jgi:hypothetical protein
MYESSRIVSSCNSYVCVCAKYSFNVLLLFDVNNAFMFASHDGLILEVIIDSLCVAGHL